MSKQDIIDGVNKVLMRLRLGKDATTGIPYQMIEYAEKALDDIPKNFDGMMEYRPGDKAILQAVIADMPKHPHVDDTVSRRALERLVGEMDD